MNYPVWDVAFGAGLLMALVSILHVFVSHFAVGGGLFLVLTEKRALRENNKALLQWLKTHTKFFALVTVVFGAVSGVGIWFTIALINPSATSSLIHSYVWGWAIEWVFFFLEIAAVLLYWHGWDKLESHLHLWYGWIYFIAAFASLVTINGIITFMLTSGKWIDSHSFWVGFFNPTYFPSLAFRFCLSLALAGIYALVTASLQHDLELKRKLVRWSAAWIIPSFVVLPFLGWWYIQKVPSELWASARGPMPTATGYASLIGILAGITFLLSLLSLIKPQRFSLGWSLLILLSALGTTGAFEFTREAVRKPYIIANYMYGNGLYVTPAASDGGFTVENIDRTGVLKTAAWVQSRESAGPNKAVAGREIFRIECQSCHTANAYRGIIKHLKQRQWDSAVIQTMLGSLDLMHNGSMPPFAGSESERDALASFLGSMRKGRVGSTEITVFDRYCAPCHQLKKQDSLFTRLRALDAAAAESALQNLPSMFVRMPNLQLTSQERISLVHWVNQQF